MEQKVLKCYLCVCLLFCVSKSHPLSQEELRQALKMERELDLQGGILPRKVKERMARFFTDSADASIGASGNLLDLGLDSDTIMSVRIYIIIDGVSVSLSVLPRHLMGV